jgi:hypothetical protein
MGNNDRIAIRMDVYERTFQSFWERPLFTASFRDAV